ncbi:unnamed protein product [Ilex paraguariensis]|uniref:Uncharacterized protein n=1 Tax=Ilex paraguariensis TaxID=185542 RepID=A0ABC8V3A4_9AQUA
MALKTFKGEWDAALAFAGVALDSPQQHRYTPSLMVVEVEESLETPPALPQVNIPHPKVPLIPSAPSALAAPLAPTIDSLLIDMDALLEDDSVLTAFSCPCHSKTLLCFFLPFFSFLFRGL